MTDDMDFAKKEGWKLLGFFRVFLRTMNDYYFSTNTTLDIFFDELIFI